MMDRAASRSNRIRLLFTGTAVLKTMLVIGIAQCSGVLLDASQRRDSNEIAHGLVGVVLLGLTAMAVSGIANRMQRLAGAGILDAHGTFEGAGERSIAAQQAMAMASGFTPGFFSIFGMLAILGYASLIHPLMGLLVTMLVIAAIAPTLAAAVIPTDNHQIRPAADDIIMPLGITTVVGLGSVLLSAGALSHGDIVASVILTTSALRDAAALRPLRRYLQEQIRVVEPTAAVELVPEALSDAPDLQEAGPSPSISPAIQITHAMPTPAKIVPVLIGTRNAGGIGETPRG